MFRTLGGIAGDWPLCECELPVFETFMAIAECPPAWMELCEKFRERTRFDLAHPRKL